MTTLSRIQQNADSETLLKANNAWFRTIAGADLKTPFSKAPLKPWPIQSIRARADRKAFWSRYHDPDCQEALRCKDPGARLMLTALERGRIGALGSRTFPGVGRNMAEHVLSAFPSLSLAEQLEALALARLARERQQFPAQAMAQLQTAFRELDGLWEPLAGLVEDQEAFGRQVLAFLETSAEGAILA